MSPGWLHSSFSARTGSNRQRVSYSQEGRGSVWNCRPQSKMAFITSSTQNRGILQRRWAQHSAQSQLPTRNVAYPADLALLGPPFARKLVPMGVERNSRKDIDGQCTPHNGFAFPQPHASPTLQSLKLMLPEANNVSQPVHVCATPCDARCLTAQLAIRLTRPYELSDGPECCGGRSQHTFCRLGGRV